MNQQLQMILNQQMDKMQKGSLLQQSFGVFNHRSYKSIGNTSELKQKQLSIPTSNESQLFSPLNNKFSDTRSELKKSSVNSKRASRLDERKHSQQPASYASRFIMDTSVSPKSDTKQIVHRQNSNKTLQISQKNGLNKTTEDSRDQIIIFIQYALKKFKLTIDPQQTTDWLMRQLLRVFKQSILPNLEDAFQRQGEGVVSFITAERNVEKDFYLQQTGQSLEIFRDQNLLLIPYIPDIVESNSSVNIQDFIFIKCIGVGGFSRVYLVRKKTNGKIYAMKLIDKEFIIKNKKQGIVQNERDIMTFLEHPFMVQMDYSFESRNFVVFVIQFCSGGELFLQLKQVKRMNEDQARFYFSEICLGMLFLHSLNVVYRDIKPENILLDIDGHIKIADFGLSKPNISEDEYAYSFCGSPEYMAPEMLLKTGHNIQVDHYCLGALLYELVTGLPPFYSRNTNEIYDSILKDDLTFPSRIGLSQEIKDLLTRLLIKQPKDRLGSQGGMVEILNHKWFHSINLKDLIDKKIPPPFKNNPLIFQLDTNDLNKGEQETRDKLMNKTGLQTDVQLFKTFLFDRYQSKAKAQSNQLPESQKAYEQHYQFVCKLQMMNHAMDPRSSFRKSVLIPRGKSDSPTQSYKASMIEDTNSAQRRIANQFNLISKFRQSTVTLQKTQKGLKRMTNSNVFTYEKLPQNQYVNLPSSKRIETTSMIDILAGSKRIVTLPDQPRRLKRL